MKRLGKRWKLKRSVDIMTTAIILTMTLGRIKYQNHYETWYNLPMSRITARASENGIEGEYWESEDGLKMYGEYVIVAADWTLHPYGSIIETSRGLGIVLDTHTAKDRTVVDLATTWGKGGKK